MRERSFKTKRSNLTATPHQAVLINQPLRANILPQLSAVISSSTEAISSLTSDMLIRPFPSRIR